MQYLFFTSAAVDLQHQTRENYTSQFSSYDSNHTFELFKTLNNERSIKHKNE